MNQKLLYLDEIHSQELDLTLKSYKLQKDLDYLNKRAPRYSFFKAPYSWPDAIRSNANIHGYFLRQFRAVLRDFEYMRHHAAEGQEKDLPLPRVSPGEARLTRSSSFCCPYHAESMSGNDRFSFQPCRQNKPPLCLIDCITCGEMTLLPRERLANLRNHP